MGADDFRVEVVGSGKLAEVLAELGGRAQNIDHHLPVVAEMLVAAVGDVFEAEGPGWEDLAESTKRARRGSSYKILQDSGVMAGSIGPFWEEGLAGAKSGVDYILPHVTGSDDGELPQRNPFDLGPFREPLLDEVTEILLTSLG